MKQTLPGKFEARIGGYLGMSFSAILAENGLEYTEFAEQYVPLAAKIFRPSAKQWHALEQALDEIDVWRWKKEYLNPKVRDGTSWEFECEWGPRKVRTGGSNAFPADDDPRKLALEKESKRFDRFLAAISRLLGDEPFE
jgi:hypothetical protein